MKYLYPFILIAVLLTSLFLPTKVLAATYYQPTLVAINGAYAYQHVQEQNDQLYIVQYTIEYDDPSECPDWVGEAYLGEFSNTVAGVYSSVQPWGFWGSTSDTINWWFAIYYTAAEVTSYSITWNDANNRVILTGNPMLTWDGGAPPEESFAAILHSSSTTQSQTEQELEARFRLLGLYYDNLSGGSLDLIEEIGSVLKLTATGEIYFTSTMESLRAVVPNIFADNITVADFDHSELIDDYYIGDANGQATIYGVNWCAQTFTPTLDYALSGLQFKVLRVGNPGNVTASVRATDGVTDLPTGADLASGTVDGDEFSDYTTGEWEDIGFTDDYDLTAGTRYALVIRAIAGDANNYIAWRGEEASNDLALGERCNSVNSGVAWAAAADWDMQFAVLSRDGVTPAYGERGQERLEDSPFDMTDLANEMGLSTLWMSSIVWFGIMLAMMFAIVRATNSSKPATSVFIFLTPLGWYVGFLHYQVAVAVMLICAVGFAYQFFYKPSGA